LTARAASLRYKGWVTGRLLVWVLPLALVACATTRSQTSATGVPVAANANDRCLHGVACETCVKCHPELAARFKAAGDWCPEHGVPESQCGLCHPEVVVAEPRPPEGADVQRLVDAGQDLPSLDPHAVRGKITIFDFYADWCGPCRRVDEHVFELLKARTDVAYRKLNIVSWETPLAKRYLSNIPSLPFVVVYGKDGKPAGKMSGLKIDELDRAIAVGSGR
jgi:thiol-disulfide isomerase/thioredoxin